MRVMVACVVGLAALVDVPDGPAGLALVVLAAGLIESFSKVEG